jgi:hypothetical protein
MTLEEIKEAVTSGKKVNWINKAYEVIVDKRGEFMIKCTINNSYIGLTQINGVTLNGNEDEFHIKN